MSAVISPACRGCGACLLTCPEHAIRPGASRPLVVLACLCTGCGECVEICPADAIEVLTSSVKLSLRTDIPGEVKRRFLPA